MDVEEAFKQQEVEMGGRTASRPVNPFTGQRYYDADLGYEIVWTGSLWIPSSNPLGFVKRTITLAFGELAALGAGVKTFTKPDPLGALPALARIAFFSMDALTGFDDPAHGYYAVELGVAAVNDVMMSTNVRSDAAAAPKAGNPAEHGYFGAPAIGTPQMKLTGSVDLRTTTVGSVTVVLGYFMS